MLGYWNNPERTQEVLVDGWVNTGDLLERHEDGYFYIKGRSSEMIISGGVNIAPDEVDRIAERVVGCSRGRMLRNTGCGVRSPGGSGCGPARRIWTRLRARKLKQAIAARFRQESESMARPSTIVIVSRYSSNAVRQGHAGFTGCDGRRRQSRGWYVMVDTMRERIFAAVCDVLYIDEADLIDGDATDLRDLGLDSVRFVLHHEAARRGPGIRRAVPAGRKSVDCGLGSRSWRISVNAPERRPRGSSSVE